jgi:hypothetical protein
MLWFSRQAIPRIPGSDIGFGFWIGRIRNIRRHRRAFGQVGGFAEIDHRLAVLDIPTRTEFAVYPRYDLQDDTLLHDPVLALEPKPSTPDLKQVDLFTESRLASLLMGLSWYKQALSVLPSDL